MFANQRRGSTGMGSLVAVAVVLVAWLAGTGLLVKVYQQGGSESLPDRCEVVCRGGASAGANG